MTVGIKTDNDQTRDFSSVRRGVNFKIKEK
jgi:hypothetical protein